LGGEFFELTLGGDPLGGKAANPLARHSAGSPPRIFRQRRPKGHHHDFFEKKAPCPRGGTAGPLMAWGLGLGDRGFFCAANPPTSWPAYQPAAFGAFLPGKPKSGAAFLNFWRAQFSGLSAGIGVRRSLILSILFFWPAKNFFTRGSYIVFSH